MIARCCIFFVLLLQYTSAQAIPYGVPNRATYNGRRMPNALAMGKGLPNGIGRAMPVTGNNMAKENIIYRQNSANNLANNMLYASQKIANPNLANIFETANPVMNGNQVLTNGFNVAALENFANVNKKPNIATSTVIASVPDGATYNFGNSPIPVTVTGVSYGNNPVGINILADNLEVKGLVTVVGRMPIFGTVALNGNVPSDGTASVNYGCGSQASV